MKDTLAVLNELEQEGVLRRFALGGAMAAIFYVEAFETEDLDVLVLLPEEATRSLTPLGALYSRLRSMGHAEQREHVVIAGVPVQFLVAYNALVEEAVEQAVQVDYEAVPTRIPTAEHLAAIMVQTGRAKDKARFAGMREQVALDEARLADIVTRHGLTERFRQWTGA